MIGQRQAIVGPNFELYSTPTEEYQQYDLNFKYLEAQLGHARLLELIRESIESSDVTRLSSALNLGDEEELDRRAIDWRQRQTRIKFLGALAGLMAVGWISHKLLQPEVRCNKCGHGGARKEFHLGFCPCCGGRVFEGRLHQ